MFLCLSIISFFLDMSLDIFLSPPHTHTLIVSLSLSHPLTLKLGLYILR